MKFIVIASLAITMKNLGHDLRKKKKKSQHNFSVNAI